MTLAQLVVKVARATWEIEVQLVLKVQKEMMVILDHEALLVKVHFEVYFYKNNYVTLLCLIKLR